MKTGFTLEDIFKKPSMELRICPVCNSLYLAVDGCPWCRRKKTE